MRSVPGFFSSLIDEGLFVIPRISFFAQNSGDVQIDMTLVASNVLLNGVPVNTADFLTLLMGPPGGPLLSSADGNATLLTVGGPPVALEATLQFGGTPEALGLQEGDVIDFTALFEGRETTIPAQELINNGSFETGNFTSWTTGDLANPFRAWTVLASGDFGSFSQVTSQDGGFAALNGFDGAGPGEISMFQDITIPVGMVLSLSWMERIQSSHGGAPRTYDVEVRDPVTGNVLANLLSFSTNFVFDGDTGWVGHTVDISAFAGSTVRIMFVEFIPQFFTGPAQMEFDAISTLGLPPGVVPGPASVSSPDATPATSSEPYPPASPAS